MLQSMGSQRVGHDCTTKDQWSLLLHIFFPFFFSLFFLLVFKTVSHCSGGSAIFFLPCLFFFPSSFLPAFCPSLTLSFFLLSFVFLFTFEFNFGRFLFACHETNLFLSSFKFIDEPSKGILHFWYSVFLFLEISLVFSVFTSLLTFPICPCILFTFSLELLIY